MDWTLALSFTFVMGMLALRYQFEKDTAKSVPTPKAKVTDKLKLAKILVVALLGFAVIGYNLQKLGHDLDGTPRYEPSLVERVVRFVADKL